MLIKIELIYKVCIAWDRIDQMDKILMDLVQLCKNQMVQVVLKCLGDRILEINLWYSQGYNQPANKIHLRWMKKVNKVREILKKKV